MAVVNWDQGRKKTLSIPSSGTESDILDLGSSGTYAAYSIGTLSPAAFTGVITIEVCDTSTGTFVTLQSDNADVNLSASKAGVLDPIPFRFLKIKSDSAEAVQRDIVLIAHHMR